LEEQGHVVTNTKPGANIAGGLTVTKAFVVVGLVIWVKVFYIYARFHQHQEGGYLLFRRR